MWKWSKKTSEQEEQIERDKQADLAISLENAKGYDDDLESISGLKMIYRDEISEQQQEKDDHIVESSEDEVLPDNGEMPVSEERNLFEERSGDDSPKDSIRELLTQAKSKMRDLNKEQLETQNQEFNERIAKLQAVRECAKAEPSEFQQLLNRIKERNFQERMNYMMARINQAHRDDHRLASSEEELLISEEEIYQNEIDAKQKINARAINMPLNYYDDKDQKYDFIRKTMQNSLTKKTKSMNKNEKSDLPIADTADVSKKQIKARAKKSLEESKIKYGKSSTNEKTITLTIKQLQDLVQDTVQDVLKELGIDN